MRLGSIPPTDSVPAAPVVAIEKVERAHLSSASVHSALAAEADREIAGWINDEIARLKNSGEKVEDDPVALIAMREIAADKVRTKAALPAIVAGKKEDGPLPEPPKNEPVLIRRLVVAPEALKLEEAVDKNAYVYRCLRIVAENVSSVPLKVYRRSKNPDEQDQEDLTSRPARLLKRILERPNAHQSGNDFLDALIVNMDSREALLWLLWEPKRELTSPKEAEGHAPRALYFLPARRTIKMLYEGSLAYYRVAGAGLSIPAWQVIRLGYYNPKEELRGLSPLSVAFQAADTGYAIELHHANFFDIGMKLSGIVSLDGEVSEFKYDRYKAQIDQLAGVGNAYSVLFLDKSAKFQSLVAEMKDMDFEKLDANEKHRIATAYGVPPFMLGENNKINRATAEIARRSFWKDTLIPKMRNIEDKLNVQLVPYFGDPDIYLKFDTSEVEALSEDRTDFATAFNAAATGIATLTKAGVIGQEDAEDLLRDRFGIEVQGREEDDEYSETEEILDSDENPADEFLDPYAIDTVVGAGMNNPVIRRLRQAALTKARLGRSFTGRDARRILLRMGAGPARADRIAEHIGQLLEEVPAKQCGGCGHRGPDEIAIRKVFDTLEKR